MKPLRQTLCAAALALAFLAAAMPARAFDTASMFKVQNRGDDSLVNPLLPRVPREPAYRGQNPARDAHQRGEIRSLEEVAAAVQRRYPGRLLDVKLDQSGPRWIYHLKMLTREGRVMTVAVDARTAEIIGTGGRR